MRKPPAYTQAIHYPVTAGVALLATAVTVAWGFHWDIGPLITYGPKLWHEPWRLVTSTLPHVNAFHLLFNLYWLWVFGTLLEQHFGHLRYAGILLLLAAASAAAEFALLEGGVGLSGVGYGLFGMLWVLHLFDQRFTDAIDKSTIITFVVWFFLCIVLTVMNIMPVANVAHGAGAVLGGLLGWVYVRRAKPVPSLVVLLLALAIIGAAASVGRTAINMSQQAGYEYAKEAYAAMEQNKWEQGIAGYRHAIAFRKTDPGWYYNIGVAYERLDQWNKALPFMKEAVERDPHNSQYSEALNNLKKFIVTTQP